MVLCLCDPTCLARRLHELSRPNMAVRMLCGGTLTCAFLAFLLQL